MRHFYSKKEKGRETEQLSKELQIGIDFIWEIPKQDDFA